LWPSGLEFVAQPKPVKPRASLREVSYAHSLNKLQHTAFQLLGAALLAELKVDAGLEKEKPEQIVCYLGGAGGTGKSRVIKALLALQESWGQDGRIQVCSPTGIATVLIDGITIHSLLEFWGKGTNDPGHKEYSQQKMMLFSRARLLIIDEVSMLSTSLLGRIDERLKILCGMEKPFGGLHVILAGDLCQLDPVGGDPLYKRGRSIRDQAGYNLWRHSVKYCILLEENMRFLKDPEWGKVLEDIRLGNWTDDALKVVNSRIATFSSVQTPPTADQPNSAVSLTSSIRPVVCVSNAKRHKFNNAIFAMCIKNLPPTIKPIRILSRIAKSRTARTITAGEFRDLYKLQDDKTEKIPMILDLFVGCPVMFTLNDKDEKKIANGSVGVVAGFEFPKDWQNNYIGSSPEGVFIPSSEPEYVLVKILGKETHQFHQDLPAGMFRSKRRSKTVKVQYPNREFSFGVRGFPLRLAFAATTFKVQGLSLKDFTIADWTEAASGQRHRRGEAYVALSRGEVRQAFHILQVFGKNLRDVFRPTQ